MKLEVLIAATRTSRSSLLICVLVWRIPISRSLMIGQDHALIHLGLEPSSKAYRLYNPTTKKVVVSRDVVFDEKTSWSWSETSVGPSREPGMFHLRWGDVEDTGKGPTMIGNDQHNDHHEEEDDENSDHENHDGNHEENHGEAANDAAHEQPVQLRRSDRQRSKPTYLDDYLLQSAVECERLLLIIYDEPRNFKEAEGSSKWRLACKEEIDSINKNKTWFLVERSRDMKIIGLKWVFKLKRKADGSVNKYKTRLVFEVLGQVTRCWNANFGQILKGSKLVEMRSFIGVQDMSKTKSKLKREIVGSASKA
uniref:Retrovirus-related Pol polyprotein from transposon TNT 1-94 n=1 Tax=Noccaea caerulescens TaxID=107243 RepID=A0A1J3H956_NOCCA